MGKKFARTLLLPSSFVRFDLLSVADDGGRGDGGRFGLFESRLKRASVLAAFTFVRGRRSLRLSRVGAFSSNGRQIAERE